MIGANEKWTEASLGQAIHRFKKNQDVAGLAGFLENQLADDDPCCVRCRHWFWNELGLAAAVSENSARARICFENALELEPDDADAQYNLATLKMHQGDKK